MNILRVGTIVELTQDVYQETPGRIIVKKGSLARIVLHNKLAQGYTINIHNELDINVFDQEIKPFDSNRYFTVFERIIGSILGNNKDNLERKLAAIKVLRSLGYESNTILPGFQYSLGAAKWIVENYDMVLNWMKATNLEPFNETGELAKELQDIKYKGINENH